MSNEVAMRQRLTKEEINPLPFKGRDRVGMGSFSEAIGGE